MEIVYTAAGKAKEDERMSTSMTKETQPARFGKYSKIISELQKGRDALISVMEKIIAEKDAKIAQLEAEIESLRGEMRTMHPMSEPWVNWRTIDDNAPKDGTRVLGASFDNVGGYWRIYSMFWHDGPTLPSDWEPFWQHGGLKEHPTHWAEMPALPQS